MHFNTFCSFTLIPCSEYYYKIEVSWVGLAPVFRWFNMTIICIYTFHWMLHHNSCRLNPIPRKEHSLVQVSASKSCQWHGFVPAFILKCFSTLSERLAFLLLPSGQNTPLQKRSDVAIYNTPGFPWYKELISPRWSINKHYETVLCY